MWQRYITSNLNIPKALPLADQLFVGVGKINVIFDESKLIDISIIFTEGTILKPYLAFGRNIELWQANWQSEKQCANIFEVPSSAMAN